MRADRVKKSGHSELNMRGHEYFERCLGDVRCKKHENILGYVPLHEINLTYECPISSSSFSSQRKF